MKKTYKGFTIIVDASYTYRLFDKNGSYLGRDTEEYNTEEEAIENAKEEIKEEIEA